MFCTKCGAQLNDNAKFCPKCGNPMGEPQAAGAQTYTQYQQAAPEQKTPVTGSEWISEFQSAMTEVFQDPDPKEAEYPRIYPQVIQHEYQELGGWLKFFAVVPYVLAIIGAITTLLSILPAMGIMSTVNEVAQKAGYGSSTFSMVMSVLFGVAEVIFMVYCAQRHKNLIENHDSRFFRFVEVAAIIFIVVAIVGGLLGGNLGQLVEDIVGMALAYFLYGLYLSRSVRVRTYFGSNAYLKRSFFFHKENGPAPIV